MKPVLGVQERRVVVVLAAAAVFVWGTIQVPGPSSENAVSKPIGAAATATAEPKQWDQVYAKLPMSFEANRGQSDPAVQFLSRGHGYSVFLTWAEAVLVLSKTQRRQDPAPHPAAGHESKIEDSKSAVLRMRLRGAANTAPQVSGEEELPGKSNYFIGDDPAKWRTNVPSYAKVRYSEVYSGIDLLYYGNGRLLEYDFVVAPGADPGSIRLAFEGSQGMAMDRDGDLVLKTETAGEEIRLRKPVVYQVVRGGRQEVAAEYLLSDAHEVSFKVGSYDVGEPLVIDPVLSYSTYLGGNSYEYGRGIAVDGSGNAYLTGFTQSTNFPTASPLQPANGGGLDAFVAKLNAAGSALLYSTYLGGNRLDDSSRITVDSSGNAYVTGYTESTNFPTASPLQRANGGGSDAFVAKLNAAGSALLYSTYLGGNSDDYGFDIALDGSGKACLTGLTYSTNFPTASPLQPALDGASDAFVSKLNAAGSALLYSTYLGGTNTERGDGITVDRLGNAYLTGNTQSTDFPTASPLQPAFGGGGDAFVAKLNAAGSALLYSTYLGGDSGDYGRGIAVDRLGNAHLTGNTQSTDFPTASPLQPAFGGGGDAFVAKLNAAGSALLYSTYLGGNDNDVGWGIAVDGSENAYLTGLTLSTNFPTASPLQPANGGSYDAFVAKLNAAGSALLYSTYLGGNSSESGYGIAVDRLGNAYLTGSTESTNFPTASPLQPASGGFSDAFIAKISSGTPPTLTSVLPRSGAQGRMVNVRLAGTNFVSGSTTVQISGAGITVGAINVSSPTRLTTTFSIHAAAGLRARNVTVTTPGGSSNPVTFTVREPITACDVSLPLTVTGSGGNLNITAGIGTSRPTAGSWVVGWMVFNPNSVSFYGTSLFSGTLPQANPPLFRLLSASMAPVPAVGVLNAFYSPDLCGYTLTWASTTSFAAPYPPVPRDQVEAILNGLELEDFDGTTRELPR